MLRPILKLAKSLHQYQEKSKLDRNRLIINGTSYTVQELINIPLKWHTIKHLRNVQIL